MSSHFLSLRRALSPLAETSQSLRSAPSLSGLSIQSASTLVSDDDKRPLLFSNDKLTRKFPIPQSVRNLSTIGRRLHGGPAAGTLLDESEGLGLERFDRWTAHKWCLMVSVCTVFIYGLAGLTCSALTWFKSESVN